MKIFLFALLIAFTAESTLFGVDLNRLNFEATNAINATTTPQLFQVAFEKVVQLYEEYRNTRKYEDSQDFWGKNIPILFKDKAIANEWLKLQEAQDLIAKLSPTLHQDLIQAWVTLKFNKGVTYIKNELEKFYESKINGVTDSKSFGDVFLELFERYQAFIYLGNPTEGDVTKAALIKLLNKGSLAQVWVDAAKQDDKLESMTPYVRGIFLDLFEDASFIYGENLLKSGACGIIAGFGEMFDFSKIITEMIEAMGKGEAVDKVVEKAMTTYPTLFVTNNVGNNALFESILHRLVDLIFSYSDKLKDLDTLAIEIAKKVAQRYPFLINSQSGLQHGSLTPAEQAGTRVKILQNDPLFNHSNAIAALQNYQKALYKEADAIKKQKEDEIFDNLARSLKAIAA